MALKEEGEKVEKKEYIKFRFENKNLINEELLYAICFYRNIPVSMVFKLLKKKQDKKKIILFILIRFQFRVFFILKYFLVKLYFQKKRSDDYRYLI